MKKAPASQRTQRANSFRGTTSFYRPVGVGLRILTYPLRCIGRTRLSYSLPVSDRRSGEYFSETAPAASHLPAALWTENLSAY